MDFGDFDLNEFSLSSPPKWLEMFVLTSSFILAIILVFWSTTFSVIHLDALGMDPLTPICQCGGQVPVRTSKLLSTPPPLAYYSSK